MSMRQALGRPLRSACIALTVVMAAAPGTGAAAPATRPFGQVDATRLAHAADNPGEWMLPGGDASQAYFSRLQLINDKNAGRLGFAWDYALHTTRGLEATPVVVDGVMYTSGNWGRVYALDAATGRELWTYLPTIDTQWARNTCCDAVNRGVAVWQGRVYVASLDGYLHALDAATGRLIWKQDTVPGRGATDFHYFVTGAPLIAGDNIVIGNGGADFRGARGLLSAFDLTTGKLRWRFYTVPRDSKLGAQDQAHLRNAAATWSSEYDWANGGGGSVWDGLSYDAKLDLIYFGTANPSPYALTTDQPQNDQLYTASLLAVSGRSGRLAWHYQEVPGDGWDYDATQKTVLVTLDIDGKARDVVMQAAKNGYVYILDRASGELLSAKPFAFVNWTRGIDPATGRPLRDAAADYTLGPKLIYPAMTGAHSWHAMSYSADTHLLYVPVIDAAMVFVETSKRPAGLIEGNFTVAGFFPEGYDPAGLSSLFGALTPLNDLEAHVAHPSQSRGVLRALEPRTGRMVWEQPGGLWDGGILSTAGNLVIRGDVAGYLNVYAADTGAPVQRLQVGTSIIAAPMTYRVGDEQYIAVMAGYGGGILALPFPDGSAAQTFGNQGRIVTFKLGGGAVPKPPVRAQDPLPMPPAREGSPATIAAGEVLYNRFCGRCHVFGDGVLPDLRRITSGTHQLFYEIILNGAYQPKGMPRWNDVLTRADAEAIHAYLIDQSYILQSASNHDDPK